MNILQPQDDCTNRTHMLGMHVVAQHGEHAHNTPREERHSGVSLAVTACAACTAQREGAHKGVHDLVDGGGEVVVVVGGVDFAEDDISKDRSAGCVFDEVRSGAGQHAITLGGCPRLRRHLHEDVRIIPCSARAVASAVEFCQGRPCDCSRWTVLWRIYWQRVAVAWEQAALMRYRPARHMDKTFII